MAQPIFYAFLAGTLVALVSLVGAVTVSRKLEWRTQANIRLLTSFSAGVFLIVAVLLLQEVAETAPETPLGVIAIGAGVLFMLVLSLIPEFHHHHTDEECEDEHSHTSIRRILTSDAFHNVGDGVLIATAFMGDVRLGIFTALAISLHEAVQELSEFFLLRERGYSTHRALTVNFLISLTIFVGIAAGFVLAEVANLTPILLGLAGGALLVVVFHDLLPRSWQSLHKDKTVFRHTLSFILGASLMIGLSALTPHDHSEPDGHDHDLHTEEI